MKKLLGAATILAALILGSAVAFAGTVKIGLMAPLTGAFASEGQDMRKLVELLADEVNKNGGINGDQVVIEVEDDGSTPRSAANAANRLVTKGVKLVVGTYGSAVTEASQNIYDEAGVVQIATGSTSIRLTSKNMKRFFRTCPRDDEQGRVAADTLAKFGFKKVAILHDNSAYAKGLAEETKMLLEKNKIGAIVFYDALQPNERDYTAILTKLKGVNPDVILFTGYYP
jgi:branched-chain amino acid transport system substrate-binding protein